MIRLYDKTYTTEYGTFDTLTEALVEEERNGLFELSFVMLNTDSLFNYVKEENIVVANANDTLLNQKFRIYMTRKLMNNRVEVYARHISFDLMYDYIDNVSFENQSCEYALNQLFRNSNFSKHYRGYSDIVNAQNYSMSMSNVLEAIGGKEGSIIDTFGNGAEILRDNENIHVLNKRGYDNEVTIEYKKNLTGFELEEDTTDLVTRILPYAKYNNSETNEEIIVKADYVDSLLIANYSHPYIASIDYSDKFEDDEIPTVSKLQELARKEYRDNKVDIPKQNFKIEFIPLSKCVGYESLEDKISLCDTVTIKDTRYNVNTQAKVIKTVFNVLKNRYESMELGEPRTSLGDVIGSEIGNNVTEDEVKDIINSTPSVNFPNTLPPKSILKGKSVGLASIELNWTFENKNYYFYELYASKTRDFTPNSFYLIHEGQTSSYLFQAKPNETWYFKVCAKNSHGNRNAFSDEISVSTAKIDANEWIEEATIGNALIGELSADKITSGTISGHYIDARNLSVTDGNGKRTFDIDSFGNVSLDVANFKLKSKNIATEDDVNNLSYRVSEAESKITDEAITNTVSKSFYTKNDVDTKINTAKSEISATTDSISSRVSTVESKQSTTDGKVTGLETRMSAAESKITETAITNTVKKNFYTKNDIDSKGYQTSSQVQQTVDNLQIKFSTNGGYNLIYNGNFERELEHWTLTNTSYGYVWVQRNENGSPNNPLELFMQGVLDNENRYVGQGFSWNSNEALTLSWYQWTSANGEDGGNVYRGTQVTIGYTDGSNSWHTSGNQAELNVWQKRSMTIYPDAGKRVSWINVEMWCRNTSKATVYTDIMIEKGVVATNWTPNPNEVYDGITIIDKDGIQVQHNNGSFSRFNSDEMYQTNENGDRALSIRHGGYRVYQFDRNGNMANAYLGSMASTYSSTGNLYGTGIFGTANSGYIDIGFSESSQDNQHTGISPWLRCVHYDGNTGLSSGVHSFKPFYAHDYSYYYARPRFFYGIAFPYDEREDLNEEISNITTSSSDTSSIGSRYLNIWGADGINIGVQNNGYYTGHKMTEDTSGAKLHHETWGDWDFHWWTMRNINIANTLSDPSALIDSREHKYTRESHNIMSTKKLIQDRGEDFTMDGSCIVEIPNDIKYSISRYDVNIIKYGRGDIWVSERTHDYFIVESENDIKFTWVLEGEALDTSTVSSITPYNIEEDCSEIKPKTREIFNTIPSSKYAFTDDQFLD